MRKNTRCFGTILCIAALLLCLLSGCGGSGSTSERRVSNAIQPEQVQSQVQDQTVYTNDNPPDHPVLNAITDNPLIGDEREFVRIFDVKGTEYIDEVALEPHQVYMVRIYYQNDCVLRGSKAEEAYMVSAFPATVPSDGTTDSKIVANLTYNAQFPDKNIISDSIPITAKENLNLFYVESSIIEHTPDSIFGTSFYDDSLISSYDLFTNGVRLSTTGDIYHTSEEMQYVQYAIYTQAATTKENRPAQNQGQATPAVPTEQLIPIPTASIPVINSSAELMKIYDSNGTELTAPAELEAYQLYEVKIFLPDSYKGDNPGIENMHMAASFPARILPNGANTAIATSILCTANNSTVNLSDQITITTQEDLSLFYVDDSAKQHSGDASNSTSDKLIDAMMLFTDGLPINYDGNSSYISYKLFTKPTNE